MKFIGENITLAKVKLYLISNDTADILIKIDTSLWSAYTWLAVYITLSIAAQPQVFGAWEIC